jgi:hypothetical protein
MFFMSQHDQNQTTSETHNQTKSAARGPRTYHGGCACGAVRFEVELDLAARGTSRCNCTICTKASLWSAFARPAQFKLLAGDDSLSDYQRGGKFSHFLFCKDCGVRSFSRGDAPWMGGEYYSIQVTCLDDAGEADLSGVVVRNFDGRHDNWENPRIETLP